MDLQDKISLGAAMFGTPSVDTGASTTLAEVVGDAKDGEVAVTMTDENGEPQVVTIPCDGDLREGDVATVIVQSGNATALSANGEGERTRGEVEAAASTSATAKELAEEAKAISTATGQHFFADDNGAHVTTEAGKADGAGNLLMNSEGVAVRAGANPLTVQSKSGFSIYDGEGSADENIVASLTADSVTLNAGYVTLETSEYNLGKRCELKLWGQKSAYSPMYVVSLLTSAVYKDDESTTGWSTVTEICNGTNPNSTTSIYGTTITLGQNKTVTVKGRGLFVSDGQIFVDNSTVKINGENAALLAYPVGSIYMSVNSTSPADLFGGTWEEIAGGRVLMGQSDDYAAGTTGGSATHTHTGPAHTHTYGLRLGSYYGAAGMSNSGGSTFDLWNGTAWASGKAGTTDTASCKVNTGLNAASAAKTISRPQLTTTTSSSGTGKTGSASSLPPYLAVYMWKRTA